MLSRHRKDAASCTLQQNNPSNVTVQDFAKLPWELDMPHDKAAAVLGSYLGVSTLEPASVLDLDVDQITGVHQRRRGELMGSNVG